MATTFRTRPLDADYRFGQLRPVAAALSQSHGLTCLAVERRRVLHPDDAQAQPLEAIRIRALLLLHASAYPSGPDRSSALGHPRERFAESNHRHCELSATPLPRRRSLWAGLADRQFRLGLRTRGAAFAQDRATCRPRAAGTLCAATRNARDL